MTPQERQERLELKRLLEKYPGAGPVVDVEFSYEPIGGEGTVTVPAKYDPTLKTVYDVDPVEGWEESGNWGIWVNLPDGVELPVWQHGITIKFKA